MVTPDGTIHTVAGGGRPTAGTNGDGGPAVQASLRNPVGVAVDDRGNLYINEEKGHRIRKVSPEGPLPGAIGAQQPALLAVPSGASRIPTSVRRRYGM